MFPLRDACLQGSAGGSPPSAYGYLQLRLQGCPAEKDSAWTPDRPELLDTRRRVFVTEKCRRLTSWGGNVTVYPEQDYYDPEEEVTLTCSPGYEPNYSKIKCMRSNNTNIWNVTEVFCRQKIYPPKRCSRLTSWRGNVTVYPEQDYYDPGEEVTLTCSPGYEPNYSKIKCMRGNNTNIWNVTEDFCRQKIYPPTTPPDIKEHTESSWRKVLVSWTFGLMPPMAIKLMTILTIFTVRIFSITRRRYKSTQEVVMTKRSSHQEVTIPYPESTGDNALLSQSEGDPQIIDEFVETLNDLYSAH
ncbi:uncharacterized protein LOC142094664 [Mixophyes fleayi]|uniref:uncharacterized protein LOC142094664 n=1 Tax=Mixophyes fleayi TaxID=3061075 RepID=UPI003F4E16A8